METKTRHVHGDRISRLFRKALHLLEQVIAAISFVVLIAALGVEVYRMITAPGYFSEVDTCMQNILTIVVGLEFIRMLIDTTPSNILEVLTVAITRHVILHHDDPVSNLACIACIAALFATRRFLVRSTEMNEDLNEDPEEN